VGPEGALLRHKDRSKLSPVRRALDIFGRRLPHPLDAGRDGVLQVSLTPLTSPKSLARCLTLPLVWCRHVQILPYSHHGTNELRGGVLSMLSCLAFEAIILSAVGLKAPAEENPAVQLMYAAAQVSSYPWRTFVYLGPSVRCTVVMFAGTRAGETKD
jgi:hypothetical protein